MDFISISKNIENLDTEKKLYSEFTTPYLLREEMLNTIPIDFWKQPKKILEPCCGKGGFIIDIIKYFMNYLTYIENANLRYKFIIENCIYFVDINIENIEICKKMLDPDNKFKINYFIGDILNINIQNIWNIYFDAIIGNPPYSISKINIYNGGYGNRSLWDKFIIYSLNNLISNGLLLFITPSIWRKPENELWNLMTQNNQLLYVKFYNENDCKKLFDCNINIDYFLIEKKQIYKNSIIYALDKKEYNIFLKDWNFLSSGNIDFIKNLIGKNNIIYSSSMYDIRKKHISKIKNNCFCMPIIYTINKKGINFIYSNINKGHFCISKVILSLGRNQYPYNDYDGKYAMSQNCFGIPISNKNEGELICKAINTNKFKDFLKYTKWNLYQTDWKLFKNLKPDFYKYFL